MTASCPDANKLVTGTIEVETGEVEINSMPDIDAGATINQEKNRSQPLRKESGTQRMNY